MSDKKLSSTVEKDVASWVNQKFTDAMNAKENLTAEWMNYMNAWNNSLYENSSQPNYKTRHISNLIYSTIESMRPILFDGNPNFEAIPLSPEAMPYTKAVNNVFSYEWERSRMKRLLVANSIYTLCIGSSVVMLSYTTDTLHPEGEVDPIPVSPFNLYPDPMATSVEDAEYIIYAQYVHQNVLKDMYPDRIKDIVGSDIKYTELTANRNEGAKVDNQVLLLECWCRDYSSIEEIEVGEGKYESRQKYPLGRVIITAPELGIVFESKENPYDTGRFPFFVFKDIDVPFQFWGEGEIKWLLSPQQSINDLSSQIIDNAKNTANMQWILDKNSGIPKGALTNRPGLIIRKNPGTEVRRDQPPAMPMYVSEMISRLESTIQNISGIHDVSLGRTSGRIESGTAVLALQEAAQTRLRLKIALQDVTLGELGQEWLARIKQFWKSNRLVPKAKSISETQPQYGLNGAEMQPMQPAQQMPMQPNPMQPNPMLPQQNGTPGQSSNFEMQEITGDILKQDYKIIVAGTVGLNLNRANILQTLMQLAGMPAEDGMPMVPREAILDYLPDTNKQVIMDYFEKIKAERMAQQQQQMMNNQAMQNLQQLNMQTNNMGQQVGALQQRANREDEKKRMDDASFSGYQQGMNEAQALQTMLNKSGTIPPEVKQQLSSLSDAELAEVLAKNPELVDMI